MDNLSTFVLKSLNNSNYFGLIIRDSQNDLKVTFQNIKYFKNLNCNSAVTYENSILCKECTVNLMVLRHTSLPINV